ncbi:hypothetical protein BKA56DRAFT_655969 [Ilyonectria sp. MPI-CAGE-AT-0026]|nr:hypothetical protein BKA56DRAFT_655969 [Ilyonectria sp. MPI-CAGE-AT-0026]
MASSHSISCGMLFALLSMPRSLHGVLEQIPLADDAHKIDDSPLYPSQDAMMTTYLDLKYPCVPEGNQPVVQLDIPVNTCASANFTINNNVLLGCAGLCEGFQRPEPDICVEVAPWHLLRVYRNALCPNGTEAKLARWLDSGCA